MSGYGNGSGGDGGTGDLSNFYVLKDLVKDTLSMNLDTEWTDATLFVPYQNDQALLYEYADCISVRAFFRMAGLQFQLEQRPNAEFMSPTKRVPFLRLQKNLVAEFSPIVDFVAKKGVQLSSTLTDSEKADLQAHIALIEEILRNAEMYFTWVDEDTYRQVSRERYASVYLWPLSAILPRLKRAEMLDHLRKNGWAELSAEEVVKQCAKCFQALSVKLGKSAYFFGDQPTELDALAFGHLYTILTTELPDMRMANMFRKHPNLSAFCKRVEEEFFVQ